MTPHFSLAEMIRSDRADRMGIVNVPGSTGIEAATRLCVMVLEPIRDHFGPVVVNSGFRCDALNAVTPGASPTSQHVWGPRGAAADIHVPGIEVADLIEWVTKNVIEWDQAIHEKVRGRFGDVVEWAHLSLRDPHTSRNRRSVMHISK